MIRPIDPRQIEAARPLIDSAYLDSPLLAETSLDDILDLALSLKIECLNPIRSFKGRGTDLIVARLETDGPIVCASAGNFGQGLARAGGRRKRAVIVYAAEGASPMKIDAMRRLGAEVRIEGNDFDAAKAAARSFAQQNAIAFIEDGARPEIAEGAGTMALEMTAAEPTIATVLVPVGNGSLATGVGAWYKHAAPDAEIVGVVAKGAPAMKMSFERRRSITTDEANTIADGIAVREPVDYAVDQMATTLNDVVAVSDAEIQQAMRLLHQHVGLVVEPAGAAGLAALLAAPARWRHKRVATILCGSNMTDEQMADWLLSK